MSKYIDAEKLIAEIKQQRSLIEGLFLEGDNSFYEGVDNICCHFLEAIDSLQQEQLDFPTTDEQMKEFLAAHPKIKVPEKYKNPDWLFKKQEQQEVDLDKEIEDYWIATGWSKVMTLGKFKVIARHFAEWQQEQKCHGCFNRDEVFMRGMKYAKEQILKEAVEKTVGQLERQWGGNIHFMHGFEVDEMDFPFLNSQECGYGDKVRIIILKDNKDESK